ncbi:hypothetical protein JOE61_000909 [Nocardioides salarius]|uniref:Uncharacterized protein n=1 Tax=Nocardioides salarius TaxID=374513 RepID=A0ABS2M7G3_9ACTN|nr:hypothetical protein [Nocardioides salarius]MBM7507095.1 hypothetical protein [Nocardioides salarius]
MTTTPAFLTINSAPVHFHNRTEFRPLVRMLASLTGDPRTVLPALTAAFASQSTLKTGPNGLVAALLVEDTMPLLLLSDLDYETETQHKPEAWEYTVDHYYDLGIRWTVTVTASGVHPLVLTDHRDLWSEYTTTGHALAALIAECTV